MANPCLPTGGDADASFNAPELNADPCNFSFKLPSFSFGFQLPSISLAFSLPIPDFGFELSCPTDKPIKLGAHLTWGGGRIPCVDPDANGNDL